MSRELDDAWTDEAIARYERIEVAQANYQRALQEVEVTVRSADGGVEIVVAASGELRAVMVEDAPQHLNAAILDAVRSASQAAEWARRKLHDEEFGAYSKLSQR